MESASTALSWRFRSIFRPSCTMLGPTTTIYVHVTDYEKPQRVKMHPPRFDGSNANNWISRVKYYFHHVMMSESQRLHYTVMLFNPPAAEWVFNYCANNNFVTWHKFLKDAMHRFNRQNFKNYYDLIYKLTQTKTVLEYHDMFEKYLNRIQGVPESDLFTLFVVGLKSDMQERCSWQERLQLQRPSLFVADMALELADIQANQAQQPNNTTNQRQPWLNRDN